jgi:hypothetical protein
MAQPVWITPAGSLGTIPEAVFYQLTLLAYDPSPDPGTEIYYQLIAGTLPAGIQCSANGLIAGVPRAVASLQGVPLAVNRDVTSKFTIRVYTFNESTGKILRIADRTFELTVTGNNTPEFTAPANSFAQDNTASFVGYISGSELTVTSVSAGTIQNGMVIRGTDIVYGTTITAFGTGAGGTGTYTVDISQNTPGLDITGWVGIYYDGDHVDLRFGYTNLDPNETVTVRLISGALPPGLTLTTGGLLSGYIAPEPNIEIPPGYDLEQYQTQPFDFVVSAVSKNYQFVLEVTDGKSSTIRTFTIYVYNRNDLSADNTTITADNTFVTADQTNGSLRPFLVNAYPSDLGRVRGDNYFAYQFRGNDYDTVDLTYSISVNKGFGLPPGLTLDPASGWYYGYIPDQGLTEVTYSFNIQVSQTDDPTVVSQLYPFTLTITGVSDDQVTWLTNSNLGYIENGSTSILKVQAENIGGRVLSYRLQSGAYNSLPQGLTLLPSGEIAGRTTFNTFAVDLGTTTFDKSQSTTSGFQETTFDTFFTFTVNAYAENLDQQLYSVSKINVTNPGLGYSSITPPTIEFSTPIGATAVVAKAGVALVSGGQIVSVSLTSGGAGYTSPPVITITESFGGSGAVLEPVMIATGQQDVISVFKTFTIQVLRVYNKPYQNLFCLAMPPSNDRVVLNELLHDTDIFVPEYIYRPDDPNFGVSTQVKYEHAYGLDPETLDLYVSSLYLNHYWKNLVLGSIETAQARDADGNVIYEVVYSKIIDNLVNAAGQSVAKIVNLPYAIIDPVDDSTLIGQVYPNSLVDMRNQVIDVVGQISKKLPLWMLSKQTNGRVLGFTPSWVLCYTQPGRSKQIAYYIQEYFGQRLNIIDFKVDRYVLDRTLSKNWNTETQQWTPKGSLTTFDYYNAASYVNIGEVQCGTNLAYVDINFRTLDEINAQGGIDGPTWIADNGPAPADTKVVIRDGTLLIFVNQENYNDYTVTEAWQQSTVLYGDGGFDQTGTEFDQSYTIPGGYEIQCTNTTSGTNQITCTDTTGMTAGDTVWFTQGSIGDVVPFSTNNKIYYILDVVDSSHFTITDTAGGTTQVVLTTDSGSMLANWGNYRMAIWQINIGGENNDIVTLSVYQQTAPDDYLTVTQGQQYATAQLYVPTTPGPGLTLINWQPLLSAITVVGDETTFDHASLQFIAPVDMYDTSDALDKYLVFPKANILV